MQEFKTIKMERNKNVAWVILNRPEVHNAFNEDMIFELTNVFSELENDSDIRLIMLSGTGPSFCAGADLNWMGKMKNYSHDENREDSQKLAALFRTINFLKKPVIAAVSGNAFGGGVGLMSACDSVIAIEDASFALTEVKLGLLPAVISPYVIAKMGEAHARYYFLTGDKFSTIEAKNMGLIHKVVSQNDFDNECENFIQVFLKAAPYAQTKAKELIFNLFHKSIEDIEKMTTSMIADIRVGHEAQEGMQALLEKRRPNFENVRNSKN